MGFFSRSPAKEHLESAKRALREGEPEQALRSLTRGFSADSSYKPLYEAAVDALHKLGGTEEASLFRAALRRFGDPVPFYELGYHFVDVGNSVLAIPFLQRARQLAPADAQIALELSVALTDQFRPCEALEVLSAVDLENDFWPLYEFYWCSLLCNRTDGIQEFIDAGRSELQQADMPDEEAQAIAGALDKLQECLDRLALVGRPEAHIQHWHFVQYGAAILDYFDEDDALSVAGGRYVARWGSNEHVAGILWKLKGFLAALQRSPEVVLALSDRDSEIVGRAAAEILGAGFATASSDSDLLGSAPSLVVAGRNQAIDDYPSLRDIRPSQTLFAFDLDWLTPAGITPDIAGLMSQDYYFPWEEQLKVDLETRDLQPTEPDSRSPEEIAKDIAEAAPGGHLRCRSLQDADLAKLMDFYQERAAYLKGGEKGGNQRLPFRRDSPVSGFYF